MHVGSNTVHAVEATVIGRRREAELVLAALAATRNVLLEGPPGMGKSTLLREVADAFGSAFVFVEGAPSQVPDAILALMR